jgi:hypothetical protein
MNYTSGHKIQVGDKVRLAEGCYGVVVCSIDDNEYSDGYSSEEWSYLTSGVLVYSEETGLVHFPNSDESLFLVERGSGVR